MRTNRDLYEYVVALPHTKRHLSVYLRALAELVTPHRDADGIALDTFAGLLRDALTGEPARRAPENPNAFERRLWDQIGQLGWVRSAGSQEVYLKGRKGSRWYNASVSGFLEAGAEGAFHGWKAEGEGLEEIPFLTWEDLSDFLIQGQYYE